MMALASSFFCVSKARCPCSGACFCSLSCCSCTNARLPDFAMVPRLSTASCLVTAPAVVRGFLSSSLRKMMKATMRGAPEAQMSLASLPVTLELNPKHVVVSSLYHLKSKNPTIAKELTLQLYDNACLAAGLLDDPRTMVGRLTRLLEVTAQFAYHGSGAAAEEPAGAGGGDEAAGGAEAEEGKGRGPREAVPDGQTKTQDPAAV
eukprot:GHVT01007990.1.p2 GENE.GHVT01007990.1~~GHVT01007990.1.p2  ORF type:complete len:205 (+),score=64.63 GHVT01007990.1:465-1079(+)